MQDSLLNASGVTMLPTVCAAANMLLHISELASLATALQVIDCNQLELACSFRRTLHTAAEQA
jgi:hypothetical protein